MSRNQLFSIRMNVIVLGAVLLVLTNACSRKEHNEREDVQELKAADISESEEGPQLMSGITREGFDAFFWKERQLLVKEVKFEKSAKAANLLAMKFRQYDLPEASVFWLEEAKRLGHDRIDDSLIESVRASILDSVDE